MSLTHARQALRRQLRSRRRAIPWQQRHALALKLAQRLNRFNSLRYARDIAAYQAMGSEISLQAWIKQQPHRRIYLPQVAGPHMRFLPHQNGQRRNRFGISEPYYGRVRPAWAMSAVLIPLLGFDAKGNRIGQGGGYYDRCLSQLCWRRPWLIGVAFDEQFCDNIPTAAWDQALDAVITPTRTFIFRK